MVRVIIKKLYSFVKITICHIRGTMRETLRDENYTNFIEGKRVVLVGPAEYLSKLKLGEEIDSFDIVIRVNRGMELISKYESSVGNRTDILYNCLIDSPDNGGNIDITEWKKKGVKWVSTIPKSDFNGVCKSEDLHRMVKPKHVEKIKCNFNFHIMNYKAYGMLNTLLGCRANTGYSAIFDLLTHKCKELFVTGFSFYLDAFTKGYKDGCERNEDIFAQQCFVSKRHNQNAQRSHLKAYSKGSNILKFDPVLQYILEMDEFSREKFNYDFSVHTD